jgi:hypothetical protein
MAISTATNEVNLMPVNQQSLSFPTTALAADCHGRLLRRVLPALFPSFFRLPFERFGDFF